MYAWNLDAMANNQVSLIIGANSQVGQIFLDAIANNQAGLKP